MNNSYPKLTRDKIYNILTERFNNKFLFLKDLPHPSLLKNMNLAVERIIQAIKNNEKIILVGDYDVDGVISTSVVINFFDDIGAKIDWIIPNRFRDGYGLSTTIMPRIKDYDLVITVDNGIAAVGAAKECKKLGIDLIITDHHIVPQESPTAYAIINQKQIACTFPYEEICGAQIAWYLCSAINIVLQSNIKMGKYLELVAIAIIADVMPLQHINRVMVQSGIRYLNKSDKPFVRAYKKYANKDMISSEDIAFSIAPIINCAGRLEDASLAVEFISSKNIYDAKDKLDQLIALNERRKQIEQEITSEASKSINNDDKVIVVASDGWHEGVVGIVASRLAKKFERPAIVLNGKNGNYKGSGRSFGNCDLFGLVDTQRGFLDKFGGHHAAIGMSIKSDVLSRFTKSINDVAQSLCSDENFANTEVIGELSFALIDFSLIDMISEFEPFGAGNTKPKFISKNIEILDVKTMGKDANHLRFTLRDDDIVLNGVQFKTYEKYELGQHINIIYSINKNIFRSQTSIQLMIEKILLI